jgi:hypothetical protein
MDNQLSYFFLQLELANSRAISVVKSPILYVPVIASFLVWSYTFSWDHVALLCIRLTLKLGD